MDRPDSPVDVLLQEVEASSLIQSSRYTEQAQVHPKPGIKRLNRNKIQVSLEDDPRLFYQKEFRLQSALQPDSNFLLLGQPLGLSQP